MAKRARNSVQTARTGLAATVITPPPSASRQPVEEGEGGGHHETREQVALPSCDRKIHPGPPVSRGRPASAP